MKHLTLALLMALAAGPVFAQVSLPPLFGDHAILQKGPATGIWGKGAPGETVELDLGTARATAVTAKDGWWRAKLDLSALGEGPYELKAKGAKNEVVSKDILVGEVWLASGQSNMELNFVTTLFGTVFGFEDLCKRAAGRPVRVFRQAFSWSMARDMSNQGGRWILPKQEELTKCSAVAFSFAEALQREIGGPVAVVDDSIGGTRTMQWTSHERLENSPTWHDLWTNQCEQLARKDFAERWKAEHNLYSKCYNYEKLMKEAKWKTGSLPTDVARGVTYYRIRMPIPEGFMETGVTAMTQFFLKGFRTTRCSLSWFCKERGGIDGEALQREDFEVRMNQRTDTLMRTIEDGKMEFVLRIEAILPGAKIAYDRPRLSKWDKLAEIKLPQDGWDVYEESVYPPLPEGTELPKPYAVPFFRIGNFYNSMVYPFRDLTFRGAIWYQGCSDACFDDNVREYALWFKTMVDDWRATFSNGEFPFYWCQLAGYGGQPRTPGEKHGQAEIREAQRRARGIIPNGEMAVIFDTGESECHGRNKIPAGERLARIALARDYGRTNLVWRSADYLRKEVDGGAVTLFFDINGSPLCARPVVKEFLCGRTRPPVPVVRRSPDSQLEGFELRDTVGAWHWADAEIVGPDRVRVSAKGVANPAEVRYNWGGMAAGNLWNEGGLPVGTFSTERTDWKLECWTDRPDGIYRTGEEVAFSARLLKNGLPMATDQGLSVVISISGDGCYLESAKFPANRAARISTVRTNAGWVSCFVQLCGPDGKEFLKTPAEEPNKCRRQVNAQLGAMVDPLDCRPGAPEPEDFDAYWAAERAKVMATPANAKFVKNDDPSVAGRDGYYLFSADLPAPFKGPTAQVTIPQAKGQKFPIYIFVHGTGVHVPSKASGQAPVPLEFRSRLPGPFIYCNLNAHGYEHNRPDSYYHDLDRGALKLYQFQGSESDKTWYMKGLVLRLMRTIDELCKRPEWDGKNILIQGGSQGGAQALLAGGIDPRVNFVFAGVPAMCDFGGNLAGHAAGWPKPYFLKDGRYWRATSFWDRDKTSVPDDASCVRRFGYVDAANFAARINPKAFVSMQTGGWDGVCPPTGVFTAYGRCAAKEKTMIFAPHGGHCQGDYEDGQLQLPAEWKGTERVNKDGFDPIETKTDGLRTLRLYAYNTYAGAGRNRSEKFLAVEPDGARRLTFVGTNVVVVSNGRSWPSAEADLYLDGEQTSSALQAKLYRHQAAGVRATVVDGCTHGKHILLIRLKKPWRWCNLGIEEIVVTGPDADVK